jgi:hypothetical protein
MYKNGDQIRRKAMDGDGGFVEEDAIFLEYLPEGLACHLSNGGYLDCRVLLPTGRIVCVCSCNFLDEGEYV